MTTYRLALDIGTNSLEWCVRGLEHLPKHFEPVSIINMGVRVSSDGSDPQSGVSIAVKRRMARGMRRNRDLFVERSQKREADPTRPRYLLTDTGVGYRFVM